MNNPFRRPDAVFLSIFAFLGVLILSVALLTQPAEAQAADVSCLDWVVAATIGPDPTAVREAFACSSGFRQATAGNLQSALDTNSHFTPAVKWTEIGTYTRMNGLVYHFFAMDGPNMSYWYVYTVAPDGDVVDME